jgi:hypothetical protein
VRGLAQLQVQTAADVLSFGSKAANVDRRCMLADDQIAMSIIVTVPL